MRPCCPPRRSVRAEPPVSIALSGVHDALRGSNAASCRGRTTDNFTLFKHATMTTRWHFPRKKARRVILGAFPIRCSPNLGFLLVHSTLLEPALLATNVARSEANAPNLARALWNVVMELAYGCLTKKMEVSRPIGCGSAPTSSAPLRQRVQRLTRPLSSTEWLSPARLQVLDCRA
jgi:hypothetical protein